MLSDTRSVRGCALRIACWTSQSNFMDPAKVIHKIASNRLLSSIVNSTAIEDAMLSGINGRDCMTYNPCPVKEEYIPMIIHNILAFTSS
ncbi:hypothetical protein K1T71_010664 [Dendrolimus kikuchii]|uniref:Uncharacterized protein n=1 Tax=Dendrolimus kikuchii TaxID=765133 RepID=A0ACC1CPS0_9NEOP|nr:hypothetical protein K1T71_010664 [Dendrolimus kikuchii]